MILQRTTFEQVQRVFYSRTGDRNVSTSPNLCERGRSGKNKWFLPGQNQKETARGTVGSNVFLANCVCNQKRS
jgi:hypothetical protein